MAGSLLALTLAVQPAAAFNETVSTGNTGLYTINDESSQPGIACRYENNPGQLDDELNKLNIRQLWTHSPYNQKTWVGFQYEIQRNTPPHGDNVFTRYYRSPITYKKANQTEVAFYNAGFFVPENTTSRWRVKVVIRYYAPGGHTQVVGRVAGFYEYFEHIAPDASADYTVNGNCRREFH
jgi:hypothetical protein